MRSNHDVDATALHPLAAVVGDAAAGRFPPPDTRWHRLPPWRPGLEAVVAFTAHAVLCVDDDVDDAVLDGLGVDGVGGAHMPGVLTALAGPGGWVDNLDVLMVHPPGVQNGVGPLHGPSLVERPDLAGEPRVVHAALARDDFTVLGYPDARRAAVAVVGRGLAGMTELSYELEPERRGRGEGAALVQAALRTLGSEVPVVARVAPGNAASLRVLLACGFLPIGSVQLVRRTPGYVPRAPG